MRKHSTIVGADLKVGPYWKLDDDLGEWADLKVGPYDRGVYLE